MEAASFSLRAPVAVASRTVSGIALGVIVVIATALRFASLGSVPTNPFYDAAVRSMSSSWHNFFFAAFEPGGKIAVDKPPLDLWLQVASVKLFGFNSVALKLPEAAAGVASILLIYALVRRLFGRGAAIASAAALAVLPITVLTSRSDTMDTLMMALLIGAAWLVVRAAETGRWHYLLAAGLVLGLDFNVKLFEALLPLPALAALYLMASPLPLRRRLMQGVAALGVFLIVALSWPVAVSLAPANQRPYPLGSTDGTVWNSIFVFNGINRGGGAKPPPGRAHRTAVTTLHATKKSDVGTPSPTRLVSQGSPGLGVRLGVELVPAIVFGLLALLLLGLAPRDGPQDESRRRLERAGVFAIAIWLLTGLVAFSLMSRLHPRYLEAFTPAVAAALGVGVAYVIGVARRSRTGLGALITAVVTSSAYAIYLSAHAPRLHWVVAAAAIVTVALLTSSLLTRSRNSSWSNGKAVLAGGLVMAVLLAVPASESIGIVNKHLTDSATGHRITRQQVADVSRFLARRQGSARFEVAALNAWQAAPLIVQNGQPVLILRNVDGVPLLSIRQLKAYVSSGQLRYALLGPRCGRQALVRGGHRRPGHDRFPCPPTSHWVRKHGSLVTGLTKTLGLYRIGRAGAPGG